MASLGSISSESMLNIRAYRSGVLLVPLDHPKFLFVQMIWTTLQLVVGFVVQRQSGSARVLPILSNRAISPPVTPPLVQETWLSVKDFGALGDGVADDSIAIQAAVDAATKQGVTLHLPAGV